ncbi:PRC-barrel domain containing protein [Streptomyces sp. NPDC059459]|uniref:PRC-barrel domain containing protein n=1 Tax=Streptomyces sp. NPDC059459 TaxID=3346839 RepID=UPI0036839B93
MRARLEGPRQAAGWTSPPVREPGHASGFPAPRPVYVDTSTDEPAMDTVQVGLPTRRLSVFAPLHGAVVGPGYVKVDYERALVKKCPATGTDDVLPIEDEAAVFAHYGLPYPAGANGERQLARR